MLSAEYQVVRFRTRNSALGTRDSALSQGMRTQGEYTLFGCTVSPVFEYSHYEKGNRKELTVRYPEFAEKIKQLTDPEES